MTKLPWFRVYKEMISDVKFRSISRKTHTTKCEVLGLWLLLMGKAGDHPQGIIDIDFEDFDLELEVEDGTSEIIFNAFVDKKMISQSGEGWYLTKWAERQELEKSENKKQYDKERYSKNKKMKKSENDFPQNSISGESEKNFSTFDENEKINSTYRGEERRGEENRGEEKRIEETREEEKRGESVREETSANSDELSLVASDKHPCPQKEIITLYHSMLPELPQIKIWSKNREALLKQRWKEDKNRQNIDWWKQYFALVKRCDFLVGKVQSRDRPPFLADLEWLVKPANMTKVLEGKYTRTFQSEDDIERITRECKELGYDGVLAKHNEKWGSVSNDQIRLE